MTAAPAGELTRHYVKLCDLADFEDARLIAAITSIVPERDPHRYIERKVWEFAMVALFLEEAGHLDGSARVLSVGAGNERILFWLANRVGRVVATDIYGSGPFAGREAESAMLADPRSQAPYPYREDRLEVRWMDARELSFPDESFDAVFSVSSIEHVGGGRDVERAAAEIGRVLRPGGHAVIVTECLVRHSPLDSAPVDFLARLASLGRRRAAATPRRRGGALAEVFTPGELERRIIAPSGLELVQPLDRRLSPECFSHVTRPDRDGAPSSAGGHPYPLVMVGVRRSLFTSVCLALRKPKPSLG